MKVKKKLTSVLSLTLALCMLLSTAALALDTSAGASSTDVGDSSYSESVPSDETEQPADADSSGDADTSVNAGDPTSSSDAEPVEPADPTDPAETPAAEETDPEEEPAPDLMAVTTGWAVTTEGTYTYTYWESNAAKVAGETGNYAVLYLPEQTLTSGETMAAGYYYFKDGVWANSYSDSTHTRYKNIGVVQYKSSKYQVTSTYSRRILTMQNGVGEPYTGYGLGTESVPNLYYYVDGNYQTSESKAKVTGYITFEENGKLYYGDGSKYYASPFTGRRTEDGYSRRYQAGEPYTGYGLGTQKVPNLYYYVDGYYNKYKEESKSKLASPGTGGYFMYGSTKYYGGDGWYKFDGKWYYTTTDSLNYAKGGTRPYAILANKVYRIYKPNGKLYYYTSGAAHLYTGVYQNVYYSKGVKQTKTGWIKVGGYWYYFKSGKAVTGWQYLSRNSKTYKYYFKADGTLVEDLFTYFGNSYLTKPMIIQVNRTTHTADILLYDSTKKSYCIAASSFVCSTCQKSSDFHPGTYYLYSNRRKRWFTFTHPETKKTTYYQYATFIVGTDAWIHSPQYKKKGNIYSLTVSNYNRLGTNQSFYCVRFQTLYSKRVYDAVGKQGSKKVKVKLYNSSNKGPYGQIKLADSTGKLSSKTTYDPTDPAVKK